MRKDRPLSELLKNEKVISQSITKEQVYENLVLLAFNEAYDTIERNAKKGSQPHILGPFDRFLIPEEYYQAMIEKECDLYKSFKDTEYGTYYYLVAPQLFQVSEKYGFIGSKCTVSYTQFGKRFIADLQKRFRLEGIALNVNPWIRTAEGVKNVPIGVAFPTPPVSGGTVGVQYHILYDILN